MSSNWYYLTSDLEEKGPVTLDELIGLARSGAIDPSTLIKAEGMSRWNPAGMSPQLFEEEGALAKPPAQPEEEAGAPPKRLRVTCQCGKEYGASPDQVGKRYKCRACGRAIVVPAPVREAHVLCPHCQTELVDNGTMAGESVECPMCDGKFVMPNRNGIPVESGGDSAKSEFAIDTGEPPSSATNPANRYLMTTQQAQQRRRQLGRQMLPYGFPVFGLVVAIVVATNEPSIVKSPMLTVLIAIAAVIAIPCMVKLFILMSEDSDLAVGIETACPQCHKIRAKTTSKTECLGTEKGIATITRRDEHRDMKGNRHGVTYRDEEAHVTYYYYRTHFKCKFCGHEWHSDSTEMKLGW